MKTKHMIILLVMFIFFSASCGYAQDSIQKADSRFYTVEYYKGHKLFNGVLVFSDEVKNKVIGFDFSRVIHLNSNISFVPIFLSGDAGINYFLFKDIVQAFQNHYHVQVTDMFVEQERRSDADRDYISGLKFTHIPQRITGEIR